MTYTHGKVIKIVKSADGQAYLDIVARDDGLFEFRAYKLTRDDPHEYWTPTHQSGLYDDLETAEGNAKSSMPWLGKSS